MKKLLLTFPIVIGIFIFGMLLPKSNINETSNNTEVIQKKDSTKSKLRIYYIRHAEGGHNVKKEWGIYPESEWPSYVGDHSTFTPKGIMQLSRVTNKLNRFNFDFVAVSPAWRCKKTVLLYLEASKMKAEIWPELAEIYATNLMVSPDLPEHTATDKILGAGDAITLLPEEAPYFTLRKDGLHEFKKMRFPRDHSESAKENAMAKVIIDRVLELIDERSASHKTILLSGHGSSGKAVLRMLTKNPLNGFPQITNTGIWMVEQQEDGSFKLMMFNDVPLSE
ncbi:histidine phosphatase family protein [Mariniflexile sp. AS56]|uniref:histidine phosphatase family protein n=1 Tax=Mariniflexile sp. AS56 TaxID=3063957 RepID=UPI0026F06561|nr:histidine phosphatase family protein [Mariniflexile sp. AS56]MDO7172424.1 histidine phosphatase family protein [Mariniflexile sp. AS56]